jgi:predicted SAM-dependent methyltransferase
MHYWPQALFAWLHYRNVNTLFKTKRLIRSYLGKEGPYKLNIGCGKKHLGEGWLNADIRYGQIYLNATKKFPFADNTFNYIFSEHFIAQIKLAHGKHFLAECFRVLNKGGVLRLTTPDLEFHIRLYLSGEYQNVNMDQYSSRLKLYYKKAPSRCEFINDYMRLFGKKFNYDYDFLLKKCQEAGFRDIKRVECHMSEHEALRNLEQHSNIEWVNKYATIHLECSKP